MTVVSRPVTRVSDLKAGDHIKWKHSPGYDHHAIVESVDQDYLGILVYIIMVTSTIKWITITGRRSRKQKRKFKEKQSIA